MSDKLDVNSPTFFQNRSAISELLHDCGVKVNMDYHCEGSGARFDSIKPALVNNYGYSDDAEYVSKSRMSDGDWMSLLKQQIDMQRPVIYSACGGQCHSFVCDGYGDDIYFNFNWGAGDDGNGSYLVSVLNPVFHGQNHFFANFHQALINIHPQDAIDICDRDVALDEYYIPYQNEIISGILFPWEMIPVTVTNLTSASGNSPVSWRTIPTGEESVYQAQESIVLKDGFLVERGADFAAKISPCDNCGSSEQFISEYASFGPRPFENGEGGRNGFPQQEEFASFLENGVVEGVDAKEPFTLMPNPASDYVDLLVHELGEDARGGTLTLHDVMGNERFRRVIRKGESRLTLPLDGLSSGYYFVTLKTSRGTNIQKLVIN